MSKKFYLSFILTISSLLVLAQDDLLKELEGSAPKKKEFAQATFKGTRIVNGHSIQTKGKGELEFIIAHRFGTINSGGYNLFGLDEAYIRIGLDYGITDRMSVGVGRSSFNKIYDGYVKYRFLQQGIGGGSPVSMAALFTTGIQTSPQKSVDPTLTFFDRATYTYQLMIARKMSPSFSLQFSPTFVHSNRVDQTLLNNDQVALGIGTRYKLTRSLALNLEYYYRVNPLDNSIYNNSLGIGLDIETGGHVFQLILSNTQGMVERTFINETEGDFFKGDIHFGFNITRAFQVKHDKD